MKAEELMIGDLVHPIEMPDIVCQVRPEDYVNLVEYDPIHLTPEILEKNGWEYNNYNNETEYEEEYYVDENGFDIHINVGKFEIRCIDGVNIKLNYVHELQHT